MDKGTLATHQRTTVPHVDRPDLGVVDRGLFALRSGSASVHAMRRGAPARTNLGDDESYRVAHRAVAGGDDGPTRRRGEIETTAHEPGGTRRGIQPLSLIHISEPTRQAEISYAV